MTESDSDVEDAGSAGNCSRPASDESLSGNAESAETPPPRSELGVSACVTTEASALELGTDAAVVVVAAVVPPAAVAAPAPSMLNGCVGDAGALFKTPLLICENSGLLAGPTAEPAVAPARSRA